MFKYTFNEHFNAVATFGYNTNNATRDIQRTSIDWYNYAGTRKVMTNPQQEESNYIKSNSQTDLYTSMLMPTGLRRLQISTTSE